MSAHVGTLAPSLRHTLAEVEGHGYGVVVECDAARRRLDTRDRIDQRSDATLLLACRALESLVLEQPSAAVSRALALLRHGMALDAAEDRPCAEAGVCVERAATEGRAIGALVEAAASCDRCGRACCSCGGRS